MDTTSIQVAINTAIEIDVSVPIYQRPALRPSRGGSFRVYKDQWDRINKDYPAQGSELVRALLDKFFRGEIPDVKEQLRG